MFLPGVISSSSRFTNSISTVRSVDVDVNTVQRLGVPFTIETTTSGVGNYQWRLLDVINGVTYTSSSNKNPTFTINSEGEYVPFVVIAGTNTVKRVFWHKKITCLPELFAEGDSGVYTITCGTGNTIVDCSAWPTNRLKVFVKRSGATIGKLRFENLNQPSRCHILIDPNNRMEARNFSGGHGLQFINCSRILFDGCGNPNEDYNFYCNANGLSTSHGVSIGESNGIPCSSMHLCGIETNTPTSGASGFRFLADETNLYNRNTIQVTNNKLHKFKVTNSGHEGLYIGFNSDTDTGDGGPPQFYNFRVYDGWIVDSGRDGLQPCNCVEDLFIHNIRIDAASTLGEGSHASYISVNPGNSGHIFNITGASGMLVVSQQFGYTGGEMWIWNIQCECNNIGGSTQTFIQVGNAPNTNLHYWNWNEWGLQNTKIGYRLDSSVGQGPQDINVFHLINQVTRKGTSANFLTVDGTQSQALWVTNQGNLTYTNVNEASADLDANYRPASASCPAISGGVDISAYIPYTDFFGSYDSGAIELIYDLDGYCVTDGQYFSGPYSGIPQKLAVL